MYTTHRQTVAITNIEIVEKCNVHVYIQGTIYYDDDKRELTWWAAYDNYRAILITN